MFFLQEAGLCRWGGGVGGGTHFVGDSETIHPTAASHINLGVGEGGGGKGACCNLTAAKKFENLKKSKLEIQNFEM